MKMKLYGPGNPLALESQVKDLLSWEIIIGAFRLLRFVKVVRGVTRLEMQKFLLLSIIFIV
jgi:hypothetical protein